MFGKLKSRDKEKQLLWEVKETKDFSSLNRHGPTAKGSIAVLGTSFRVFRCHPFCRLLLLSRSIYLLIPMMEKECAKNNGIKGT
jgi:hypothetical protein